VGVEGGPFRAYTVSLAHKILMRKTGNVVEEID